MSAHARNAPVIEALEEGPGIEMEDQQSEGRHHHYLSLRGGGGPSLIFLPGVICESSY